MSNVDKLYVGRVIRQKRKDLGLKQSELAEMVGISEKHLSKIETGKNYPALDNFFKMTEILKLSLKDFVSEGIDMADISSNKNKLKMIVNIATEQQVNMYGGYDLAGGEHDSLLSSGCLQRQGGQVIWKKPLSSPASADRACS